MDMCKFARISALNALVEAIKAEVDGMKAANGMCHMAYPESEFVKAANELRGLHDELQAISRDC